MTTFEKEEAAYEPETTQQIAAYELPTLETASYQLSAQQPADPESTQRTGDYESELAQIQRSTETAAVTTVQSPTTRMKKRNTFNPVKAVVGGVSQGSKAVVGGIGQGAQAVRGGISQGKIIDQKSERERRRGGGHVCSQ
jgi:hypothetical protein